DPQYGSERSHSLPPGKRVVASLKWALLRKLFGLNDRYTLFDKNERNWPQRLVS
ncbi:unnamed protein product, partial [Dovyalis caffra]